MPALMYGSLSDDVFCYLDTKFKLDDCSADDVSCYSGTKFKLDDCNALPVADAMHLLDIGSFVKLV